MLTELGVVLCLDFVSLAFAVVLGRWALGRGTGGAEARRLVNAATRAAESFLLREGKLAAAGVGAALLLIAATHGYLLLRRGPETTLSSTLWTAFAVVLGAGLTAGGGYLATEIGLHATLRTAKAAELGLEHATTVALRAAGVGALAADALGAATVAFLLGLLYLLGGGTVVTSSAETSLLLERAATVLPGLGLGSVTAALVLGAGGSAYRVCANVGALGAAGLDPADPRNPSMVANLVGDHVGTGARRSVDMFAATTLANVAVVTIGVAAFRLNGGASGARAWSLVTLPLVVRAIGALATPVGLLTGKATDSERPTLALWRGQITTALLVLGGLAGASLWLIGPPTFVWAIAAGASGVVAGFGVSQGARRNVDRRLGAVQGVLETARTSPIATVARGLSVGSRSIWLPVALLAVSLASGFKLGERTALIGGGLLGTALALTGFVATSGYMLALGLFGPIASGAASISALEPDATRPDARRTAALDDAGFESGRVADLFFIALGAAAAIVTGLSIPLVAEPNGRSAASLGLAEPAIVWSGVAGACLVLLVAGMALDVAARAMRGTLAEVERQLRTFPREREGRVVVPEGYTPSYRLLIELAGRLSAEGVLWPTLFGLVAPAVLGFGLRLLYTSSSLAAEGLTAFVVIAAATGLATALATDGAHSVLGAAQRESRPWGASAGPPASFAGQLGSFIGDMFAPAAHSFPKALAATALVIAPLLSR
ncbi:MAG TPA: sodium/proton-translocating pyrophosphatase [Polyangiaceae bacterium]|nr:sodium/proton-translocating pyrophosphatase [Polyangiaceae bacterium]